MAKLLVPPVDTDLRRAFRRVVDNKALHDDACWAQEILPLLLARVEALEALVKHAVSANAHPPSERVVEDICRTLRRLTRHLTRHFAHAAPFTVRRLAELTVLYVESGYTLTLVAQAHKYVLALAAAAMVQSCESDFAPDAPKRRREDAVDSPQVAPHEYEQHDLPPNVRFVHLPWAQPQFDTYEAAPEEPTRKKAKEFLHDPLGTIGPLDGISTIDGAGTIDSPIDSPLLDKEARFDEADRKEEVLF